MTYWRPLPQTGRLRPDGALPLAGGWCWFTHAVRLERGRAASVVPATEIPAQIRSRLTAPRAPVAGLSTEVPRVMAILNVTPDSFSDGGLYDAPEAARAQARDLIVGGADILDVGGESTRPGADVVPAGDEIARTAPVIAALRAVWDGAISVDTRKSDVARAGVAAGATMLNDVSAMTWDAGMAAVARNADLPICLMHAQGTPQTMQDDPVYEDVLLDVYDHLEARVAVAEAAGIPRSRVVVDPGIGFGKTLAHNLALLEGLSLFHAMGCAVLLGASRKRFVGILGDAPQPRERMPGSVAVALAALGQGVQFLRVHDMSATRQAIRLWWASTQGQVWGERS